MRSNRKTLVRSRSFGGRVTTKENLRQALAKHAQRAAEKLRTEGLVARGIEAFITTKRFGEPPHYSNGGAGTLAEHTARASAFVKATRRLLDVIYREGYGYKKASVRLYDIRPGLDDDPSEHVAAVHDPVGRTAGGRGVETLCDSCFAEP